MECPKCGYIMTAFDQECPRCKKMSLQQPPVLTAQEQRRRLEAIGTLPPQQPQPDVTAHTTVSTSAASQATGLTFGGVITLAVVLWLIGSWLGWWGPRRVVTYEEYRQIQDGMSYDQVVTIIGEDGTEDSRNHMDGVPGVMDSITTIDYRWMNSDGSNASVMFQNDKVVLKAQAGLD